MNWLQLVIVVAVLLALLWLARGSERREPGERIDDDALDELLAPHRRPCVLLRKTAEPSRSHLGGRPPNVTGVSWPAKDGRPMGFLACLDLAELSAMDWLPASGRLLFFYDLDEQPWGFDPKDRGSWAVVHVPETAAGVPDSDGDGDGEMSPPAQLRKECELPRVPLQCVAAESSPPWDHSVLEGLELTTAQSDRLAETQDSIYAEHPRHQVGGHPSAVQGSEMDLDCQLASNGLFCGDASGYNDPRAAALKPGAEDWKLLLQIDSDDDLNMMWGDLGMLYFWVRAPEAREGDFSGSWVVMQCH